jgi:hypothetical protein
MMDLSDREEVSLIPSQWKILSDHSISRNNALWRLCELLEKLLITQASQSADLTKWIGTLNDTSAAGFVSVVEALATIKPLPPPQPQTEVRFVFKVADDHQSESFSISIGSVTDAEGQSISDPSGLSVKVESSDESIVAVLFDEASKSGSVSFGSPGVASVTATVTNVKGDILGSGAADFTVTTGDPAAVSDVKLAFGGLTEEPTI